LWALVPFIAFNAEIKQGVGLPALMTFMVGFGPFLIFLASFVNHKSLWELTSLDVICGGLSIFGILLWKITGSGNLAILFSLLADGLAGAPTVIKSYKNPESENWHVFFLAMVNAAITLLTIDIWNFAHYAFPLYIFVFCLIIVILIKFKVGTRYKLETKTNRK
jgi:hypothetical protein